MLLRNASTILLFLVAAHAAGPPAQVLFDGRTLDGWIWSTTTPAPTPSWTAANGLLQTTPGHGQPVYLLTRESFTDFDFSFEWKCEPGGNSGVKYRFQGYWDHGQAKPQPEGSGRIEPIALEYQLIDDEKHPDARSSSTHSTAAIYEYWPARKSGPARANVWHTSRIVARGLHVEHWLDGHKVLNVELDAPAVQESFRRSTRRGSSPLLARHERRESPVALQFHDGVVAFRQLKIRRLGR